MNWHWLQVTMFVHPDELALASNDSVWSIWMNWHWLQVTMFVHPDKLGWPCAVDSKDLKIQSLTDSSFHSCLYR